MADANAAGNLPTQKVSDIVSTFRPIRVRLPVLSLEEIHIKILMRP